MSHSNVHLSRRVLFLLPFVALALFIALVGQGPGYEHKQWAASAASAGSDGKPLTGPAAVRSVVDIRKLPQVSGAPKTTKPSQLLPYRYPGGPAALAAARAAGNLLPPTASLLSPFTFGAPAIITGFNGININDSA